MDYPSTVWSQLKNITVESLMKALEKDGWEKRKPNSALQMHRSSFSHSANSMALKIKVKSCEQPLTICTQN